MGAESLLVLGGFLLDLSLQLLVLSSASAARVLSSLGSVFVLPLGLVDEDSIRPGHDRILGLPIKGSLHEQTLGSLGLALNLLVSLLLEEHLGAFGPVCEPVLDLIIDDQLVCILLDHLALHVDLKLLVLLGFVVPDEFSVFEQLHRVLVHLLHAQLVLSEPKVLDEFSLGAFVGFCFNEEIALVL